MLLRNLMVVVVLGQAPSWAALPSAGAAPGGRSRVADGQSRAEHPALADLQPDPADVSRSCAACHEFPANSSHPVGVAPTFRVPTDFPVDQRGRVTCLTCHDVPQESGSASRAYFLRRDVEGTAYCAACHDSTSPAARDQHASMGLRAHGGVASLQPTPSPLDAESAGCMTCHDGAVARDGEVWVGGGAASGRGPTIGQTHPVGVDYADAARNDSELAPSGPRDALVRLFEGKVSCGSCHSPFSSQPNLLVLSNQDSALCLQCHRL